MTRQQTHIDLVAPGFRGLNTAQSGTILSPQFALNTRNSVIDSAGRLAARAGFSDVTTTEITSTPDVKTIWEYVTGTGTTEIIVAWNGGIANSFDDPQGNDISGSVTDTDGRWWFQNFNEKVVGFQDGQKPIVYTGTGNFATVVESSGTAPTSHRGVGLAAFGRVWALDSDGQTIKYSGLLDETDWGSASAGSIDMSNVWTAGMDEVTAITAFNGQLVVFGRRHIIFWFDGVGSALGLNPVNIYVTDTIAGTGCLTQWSVQPVGETDLLFLSTVGVQSIARILEGGSNPIIDLSKKVRNDLMSTVALVLDLDAINTTYSPLQGFYLLTFQEQASPAITGITYVLDQRFRYQDEEGNTLSVVTTWDLAPASWCVRTNFDLLLGFAGNVGKYAGSSTDNGATFRFVYESPWLDLGEDLANRIKILKEIEAILFVQANIDIIFKWFVDFDETANSVTKTVEVGSLAEWGVAEWGLGEWSGGLNLQFLSEPASRTGRYFKIGLEADISADLSIQQIELITKIGRPI